MAEGFAVLEDGAQGVQVRALVLPLRPESANSASFKIKKRLKKKRKLADFPLGLARLVRETRADTRTHTLEPLVGLSRF